MLEAFVITRPEELEDLAGSWDSMPPTRGPQADFHDACGWLSGWCRFSRSRPDLRVVVAMDGDEVQGVLPLLARSKHSWESAAPDARTRFRPVVRAEDPNVEVLGALVQAGMDAGMHELTLHRLPSRDPASLQLVGTLRGLGMRTVVRERANDHIAHVEGGWDAHRANFARFDRMASSKKTKIDASWTLAIDLVREPSRIDAAFDTYLDIQKRSWKGAMWQEGAAIRGAQLRALSKLGWARVFLMAIDGYPVAGHVWYRVGEVMTWLSTTFDSSYSALSPGTVLMWEAQRLLFEEGAPAIVDYLPGASAQKNMLAPERPPLLIGDAARKYTFRGVSLPARMEGRRATQGAAARFAARRARRSPVAARTWVQTLRYPPKGSSVRARQVSPEPALLRFLAVAGRHAGVEEMRGRWGEETTWWVLDDPPAALARVDRSEDVTEIVLLRDGIEVSDDLISPLARAVGSELLVRRSSSSGEGSVGVPTRVVTSRLSLPRVASVS